MIITRETVLDAASLGKLKLSGDEIKEMAEQMQIMADIIVKLNESDETDYKYTTADEPGENSMREDEILPSSERDRILANAPEHNGEYFIVPDTFEKGGDE